MWRSFKNHSPVLVQYTKDFDKRESMAKVSILNVIHIYLVDESYILLHTFLDRKSVV